MESRGLRIALRVWVTLVLLFLFVPIGLIVLYAFNKSNIESWPIRGFTWHWFAVAWDDSQVRAALWLSVRVGLAATALALVLGGMVSFALYQFRFFGRNAISLLLVLPIALPGIITGIALYSFFSFTEASMDPGARGWQTLRYITLPLSATALVSGALLAFALSFDEVIVTIFT